MAIYLTIATTSGAIDLDSVETMIRGSVPGCVVARLLVAAPSDAPVGSTGWRVKHPTRTDAEPFTASEIDAINAAFASAPSLTPQRQAQQDIDRLPLAMKAALLTCLDQINVVRANANLPAIGAAAFLAQVKAKANTIL